MKNIIYMLVSFTILLGCSKDNEENKDSIIGKWQLIEYCENIGDGTWGCTVIENGLIYYFKENGTFTQSNTSNSCIYGTFTYDSTSIVLDYKEEEECSLIDEYYILDYTFVESRLKLTLSEENNTCDEGCYEIFKKVPNE